MVSPRLLIAVAWIGVGAFALNLPAHGEPPILQVSADGEGDYRTIQEAVGAADDGAIVRIGKGTWTEAVTVTKSLTLEGAGWEVTRIVSVSAGQEQASSELVEGLTRISRELDEETQAKLREAMLKVYSSSPVVTVKDAERVVIRNLCFLRSAPVRKGSFSSHAAVDVQDAAVEIEHCAILESPGIGLAVRGDSHAQVKQCLIANAWGTGVMVTVSENGSFEIADSEIRNNGYSGLRIAGPSPSISVRRCRIHGAGWHGIRYDGSSPTIEGNVFHSTAVSGIYASGRTSAVVKQNLFYHSGISCWFQNADTIESNTFIGDHDADQQGGITQGLQVLGASQPTIRRNLLTGCENAVFLGDIGSPGPFSKSTGKITLIENAFWNNQRNLARHDVEAEGPQRLPLPKGNLEQEPEFADADNRNFALDEASALAGAEIGVQQPLSLESPWPLQREEERSKSAVAERLRQTSGQR